MAGLRPVIENPAVSALYGRVTSLHSAGAFVEWKMGMFVALAGRYVGGADGDARHEGQRGTTEHGIARGESRRTSTRARFGDARALRGGRRGGRGDLAHVASGGQSFSDVVSTALPSWESPGAAVAALGLLGFSVLCSSSQCVPSGALRDWSVLHTALLADGSARNVALRWLSPFGWLENVGAFHHREVVWLVPLLLVPTGTALTAWRLQRASRRGFGVCDARGPLARSRFAVAHPLAIRVRASAGACCFAWTVGLGVLGVVVGYLTNALVQLCRTDPGYVKLLKALGIRLDG